jgi:hypothetical protein
MKPRNIPALAPGVSLEFNESIIVNGNVGKGARLKVTGSLEVNGIVQPGAELTATEDLIVAVAQGTNTILKSEQGNVIAGVVLDDVKIDCHRNEMLGACMASNDAALLYGSGYMNKLSAQAEAMLSSIRNLSSSRMKP